MARDYKAEYARRIARGLEKGLSKSQARGHAKIGETPASKLPQPEKVKSAVAKPVTSLKTKFDKLTAGLSTHRNPFERAITEMKRDNKPMSVVVKEAKLRGDPVNLTNLKEYMSLHGIQTEIRKVSHTIMRKGVEKQENKRQLVVVVDPRNVSWYTISDGAKIAIEVDPIQASKNGYYLNDVKKAVMKGDISALDKWKGQSIRLTDGRTIMLETDLKKLKRAYRQVNPNPYAKG